MKKIACSERKEPALVLCFLRIVLVQLCTSGRQAYWSLVSNSQYKQRLFNQKILTTSSCALKA